MFFIASSIVSCLQSNVGGELRCDAVPKGAPGKVYQGCPAIVPCGLNPDGNTRFPKYYPSWCITEGTNCGIDRVYDDEESPMWDYCTPPKDLAAVGSLPIAERVAAGNVWLTDLDWTVKSSSVRARISLEPSTDRADPTDPEPILKIEYPNFVCPEDLSKRCEASAYTQYPGVRCPPGARYIATEAECNSAAEVLGLSDRTVEVIVDSASFHGCFYGDLSSSNNNPALYLNLDGRMDRAATLAPDQTSICSGSVAAEPSFDTDLAATTTERERHIMALGLSLNRFGSILCKHIYCT